MSLLLAAALLAAAEPSPFWDGARLALAGQPAPPAAPAAPPPAQPWRFAERFSAADMADPRRREEFLREVMRWEARFHRPGIGYNAASGLTYDGHGVDADGEPVGGPRAFSAASKESLHVSLLARSIAGDRLAAIFSPPAEALGILERKISSYEKFNAEYPGFGGYLPWFQVTDAGMRPIPGEWDDRVPALDNGELVWSVMALVEALRGAGHGALAARYQRHLDLMARHAGRLFYDEAAGKIRAEAGIPDPKAAPESQRYGPSRNPYHLDDAYEGELFVLFWSLYGKPKPDQVRRVWDGKRLEARTMRTRAGEITVRKGWEFSSHEEWALLVAPYLEVPVVRRVHRNNQAFRTLYSAERGLTAMFAAAHRPVPPGGGLHYDAYAIPGAGANNAPAGASVPYAAFPVIVMDRPTGLAWYLEMLKRPGMQGPLGGGEASAIGGTDTAPVVTWDGKATAVLAALGGTSDLAGRHLRRSGRRRAFRRLLREKYEGTFRGPLRGEDVPLALPPAS